MLGLYLIISKKLPPEQQKNLINDFNKGLKILKDSGRYEKMFEDMISGYYEKEIN